MSRSEFSRILQRAVVDVLGEFRRLSPDERPYALAVVLGQSGWLGYAVASEEGLRRVATGYAAEGYRYQGWEWEESDDLERLAAWLRWANPDDGWRMGDFAENLGVASLLTRLIEAGEFGENAEELEEFCTDALTGLQSNADWLALAGESMVVGVTFGSDPMDFLRTATRANRYVTVRRLWAEFRRGEELSGRIARSS